MLQEKLDEKDQEIQRLKHELQENNLTEDGKSDATFNRGDGDKLTTEEDKLTTEEAAN
jgi:hypothetical protein